MNARSKNIDRIAQKPASLLPRKGHGERSLFFILTLMSFLAGLIFLVATLSLRAADQWQSVLQSRVTVQLYLPISMSDERARKDAAKASLDLIKNFEGVKSVQYMPDDEARTRLEPWIGSLDLPDDLPLPVILSIETKSAKTLNIDALKSSLTEAGLQADINAHRDWQERIKTNAKALAQVTTTLFFCIFLGGIATSIFATHSKIESHRKIIAVLTQVGAKNFYIMRLFTARFLIKGLLAAFTGCILALMFVVLFQVLSIFSTETLFRAFTLTLIDIIKLFGIALFFGFICSFAAFVTGLSLLRSEQRLRVL